MMRNLYTTILLSIICLVSYAQKENHEGYFLLKGNTLEIDMFEQVDKGPISTQVVVYQDKDIYVAFFTDKSGAYEFYLPIGHQYEIWFGGGLYVSKKVAVDTNGVPTKKKRPSELKLDMALFQAVDGYDFPMLKDAYVKVAYDEEYQALTPDLDYTEAISVDLDKLFRKIKKEKNKKK
jgi:hypothetical protein